MTGLSTTVSISLGMALVAGRNRVPSPATGKIALRIGFMFGAVPIAWWRDGGWRGEGGRPAGHSPEGGIHSGLSAPSYAALLWPESRAEHSKPAEGCALSGRKRNWFRMATDQRAT